MRILLAEDQAMVRGALASLLRLSSSHELVEAADGDSALKLLKTEHFDVLLTDIEMPGRSGLELAAWLQQQQSKIKVIVITTFGRSGYIQRAIAAGVQGFLLKDAPSEQLVQAVWPDDEALIKPASLGAVQQLTMEFPQSEQDNLAFEDVLVFNLEFASSSPKFIRDRLFLLLAMTRGGTS